MMLSRPAWPKDDLIALVRLREDEKLSFAEIAEKLRKSRSAVIGRYYRLCDGGPIMRIRREIGAAVPVPEPEPELEPSPRHPLAARDVPSGTSWAFRDHRTQAEIDPRMCRSAGCRNTAQPGYRHGLCAGCNRDRLSGGRRG